MAVRKTSAVRHLSYEEIDTMVRTIVERVRTMGMKIEGIEPKDREDTVVAAMIAENLNVPLGVNTGTTFSTYSHYGADICLFKLIYNSDHYNRDIKIHVEEIMVEDDQTYQQVTMPWRK